MGRWRRLTAWFDGEATQDLERRLYRHLCLAAGVLTLGVVVPANSFQNLPSAVSVVAAIAGSASIALYSASRRGKDYPLAFVSLIVLTMNVEWFVDGGARGSVPYYFPIAFMLAILLFRGVWKGIALGLVVVDGIALLLVEHARPSWVVPFGDPHDRLVDLATGLPISGMACVLLLWSVLQSYHREHQRLHEANDVAERRLAEIKTLRGLLPVCAWCRRVRNDQGLWRQVDQYLSEHTEARVTHALCPECEREHFPCEDSQGKHR